MCTFKLENAKQDADFWSHMHDMQTATIEDHKGLIATAERDVAKGETGRAEAAVCVLMRLHEEFQAVHQDADHSALWSGADRCCRGLAARRREIRLIASMA